MQYIVRDLKLTLTAKEIEAELNKISEDGWKIISCDYVRYDYADINKQQAYKNYLRVIGEKNMGKPKEQSKTVIKG